MTLNISHITKKLRKNVTFKLFVKEKKNCEQRNVKFRKKIGPHKTQSHLYLKYARSSSIHNFHTNEDKEKLNLQRIQSNSEKICMRISPNEMIIINSRPFLSSYFSLVLCVFFFLLYKWSFVITKQVKSRRKKNTTKDSSKSHGALKE